MATHIFSKKNFIEFIEKEVGEEESIVYSTHASGSMTHSQKNGIKIPMVFSAQAFKDVGLGHIAFGKTTVIGLLICDNKRLSEEAIKALKQQENA